MPSRLSYVEKAANLIKDNLYVINCFYLFTLRILSFDSLVIGVSVQIYLDFILLEVC